MSQITEIIHELQQGDSRRADELLPLVYKELRELAGQKMAREQKGGTIQATALVHEAYLRLVGGNPGGNWNSRGHFFGAAAEAMRRILIERARRRKAERHGGGLNRIEFDAEHLGTPGMDDRMLELNEAVDRLGEQAPVNAELVKLILFAGVSVQQAGELLGLSTSDAYRKWRYSRAFLKTQLS